MPPAAAPPIAPMPSPFSLVVSAPPAHPMTTRLKKSSPAMTTFGLAVVSLIFIVISF
jgi:hypothetical protein